MELASVINNGAQTYIKFDSSILKLAPFSPQFQFPKWATVRFSYSHTPPIFSVHHRHRTGFLPIPCSRGTEQENNLSTSDERMKNCQSGNDIDNTKDSSNIPNSMGIEAKVEKRENYKSSVKVVALWVGAALAFGIGLGLKVGVGSASEFFAGYLLEQSLSVDNLFVFVLIFKYFKVPFMYQNRVLSYGIAGAVIFRLSLILLGTATLERFGVVNLLLAAILLYSSFKLFAEEEDDSDLSENFIVKTCQKIIPVTSNYDGDRFITIQDGVWKVSNILGRPHPYF